jgi:hypothetical protein
VSYQRKKENGKRENRPDTEHDKNNEHDRIGALDRITRRLVTVGKGICKYVPPKHDAWHQIDQQSDQEELIFEETQAHCSSIYSMVFPINKTRGI